ncbi:MAG: hypothetical protein K2Y21_05695 [Phycisphaerales bacterium]|nr:hypothetical protein [Phycisphaerales bacterium]
MSNQGDPGPVQLPPEADSDAFLDAAPPEYIRSLYRGITLQLIVIGASMVLVLIWMVAFAIMIALMPSVSNGAISVTEALFMVCTLLFSIAWSVSEYLLTTPDPRGVWNEAFERYRRVLRVFLWVGVGITVVGFAFAIASFGSISTPPTYPPPPPGPRDIAEFILNAISIVVMFAQTVFYMLYLEQLGIRLRDPLIAARAKLLVWLSPVLFLLFFTVIAPIAALILQIRLCTKVQSRLRQLLEHSSRVA